MRVARVLLVAGALVVSGCKAPDRQPAANPEVRGPAPTFNKDIAPILFEHCAPCHRPGQAAPFALLEYEEVKERAEKIVRMTKARRMPPWLPEAGYGEFVGERRLTDAQVATIERWTNEGEAEGEAADRPETPHWPEGWQLGKPDLVITMPKPYTVQPGEHDVFRNVVMRVALPSGRFVRAVEFRPGSAPIVHHAVISIDRTRASRRRDGADGQPGYDGMITQGAQSPDGHFLGWTPGRGPIVAPDGMPWRLDPGSDIVVQLHLLPQLQPHAVQASLGLYFTDVPPQYAPLMVKLGSKAIDIPAGDAAYAITDTYVLPVDVDVLSIYPHAHYLGKEMQASAALPDGTTRWLLSIKRWDFHWQQEYRYQKPIALPRGTTLTMKYTYDNSAGNPHNPHKPPMPVVYGPNSSDEMGDLWVQVLPRSSADAATLVRAFAEHEARANVAGAELLVRRVPEDAKNQTFLGSSYVESGRFAEAVPALEHALRLDPRSANAHNQLGGALISIGRAREAIPHLRQAAALAPDDERMQFNLGYALNAVGLPADAAQAFRRAIAINPDFAEAHDNLGVFLLSRNQLPEALVHLRKAAALAPNSADVHSNLGGALVNAGQLDEGLQHIKRALELRPDHALARQNLAILERRGSKRD
jgi:Tfp pilus assembly protein PilF